MNLDKCIGCHTCSVTCKNVWTRREGMEYAWFNNVETKPGVGFPDNWEDQAKWKGGWDRSDDGKLTPKVGGRLKVLTNLFANPDMPAIDDYYERYTYDYANLQNAGESQSTPHAAPVSLLTGKRMAKIEKSANWEDDLGGDFASRSRDVNFEGVQKEVCARFEKSFIMYLPRLCEHCLNPSCVAACPSGSIYKREEDGVVLIDQDKCRGWRMCVPACPYKKIYHNYTTGKSEKCILCYPRLEAGEPTICSETCVGRIRYLGVVFYDADSIEQAASIENVGDLYQSHLDIILDPHDPDIAAAAKADGIHPEWIESARRSPVYKMMKEWKIAFPLHPEFRTLPSVWYIPPLSPIQDVADQGFIGWNGAIPDIESLQIPVRYLANLLTGGNEAPVVSALKRMFAMRMFMRGRHVEGRDDTTVLDQVGLTQKNVEEMYRYLALARIEDRYVIPTARRESNGLELQGACSISSGPGTSTGGRLFQIDNLRS